VTPLAALGHSNVGFHGSPSGLRYQLCAAFAGPLPQNPSKRRTPRDLRGTNGLPPASQQL